ncbi:MAG: RHS repeat-associated core domain-containing protein [Caldilineaceae bacterium]
MQFLLSREQNALICFPPSLTLPRGDPPNGWLVYMHQDQLGNLALVTSGGARVDDQGFYAYGKLRRGIIGVERSFTGRQKDFGSGLIYMNARYYDPEIGTFISPNTLVPDPGNLLDYNRYAYARLNPMKYNDPTGHQSNCMAMPPSPVTAPLVLGCQIGEMAMRYGPTVIQLASQWADKLPAVDWLFSSAEQGANSAGQQNAGNSASGNPDPGDPFGFNRFSKLARDKGLQGLQRDLQSTNAGNRIGAERVLKVMEKLGDKVQNVNHQFKGQFRSGDIDILETTGNIHSIGDHTQKAGYLGGHFQYLQQFVAQSSNPTATITYWFTGDPTKLSLVQKEAAKWGVLVEVLK